MEVPLLRAKLTVPAAPASFVERAALLDRLEASRKSGSKVSLVVAPAGYGKTTLAGAWIARAGLTAGWLTLDERDNLPARFYRYFVAALETPFHGLEERLAPLLRAPVSPPTDTLVEAIVGAIENSRKRSRPEGLLVLDDLHAVKEPSLHGALDLFIEYLPEALHVILLSREPPPLRLQKLRARGALTEIGQADLELGREEADRLLRDVAGTEIAPEVAEDVYRTTEGWITALRFAALRIADLASRTDPRNPPPTAWPAAPVARREILDFLLEEVLAGQPPELREFLVRSSIFERFSAPLCEAVLGGPDLVRQTVASGLFVTPVDEEREWFRYHPLFRDMLKEKLAAQPPQAAHGLHLKAATWFHARGLLEEALDHLFQAGAVDRAAQILETEAKSAAIWDALSVETFFAALKRVPDLDRRPWLSLYAARIGFIGGSAPEAASRLEDLLRFVTADQTLPPEERRLLRIAALSDVASYAVVPGEADRALAALAEAAPLVRPTEHGVLSKIETIRGMACLYKGDPAGADTAFERAIGHARRFPVPLLEASVLCSMAEVRWQQGRLHEAHRLCETAAAPGRSTPGTLASTGLALILEARILYEWDRLEEAEQMARRGLAAVSETGITDAFGLGRSILAEIRAARGEPREALHLLAGAHTAIARYGIRRLLERLEAAQVRIALRSGDTGSAAVWADRYASRPPAPYVLDEADLAFWRVRLRQSRTGEAERGLVALAAAAGTGGRARTFLEARFLLALARFTSGSKEESFTLAASVVAEAAAEGCVRLFLDAGTAALELFRQARGRAGMSSYAALLLGGLEREAGSAAATPLLGFTPREVEVLSLLAARLANEEIAGRLFVSLPTVKTHVRHIFEKLGVGSRREAVERAREAGLLG